MLNLQPLCDQLRIGNMLALLCHELPKPHSRMLVTPPQPGHRLGWQEARPATAGQSDCDHRGAAAFLDNAIDIMRQHALHGQDIDWTALRMEAFKRAGGAFNPIDTYPAIYWALVQLGDPGSHLRLPPGLYPDQIALMQQAEKEALSNAPAGARGIRPSHCLHHRRLPEGHIVTAQGRNFGYVVLPRCSAKDNDGLLLYAADVRRILTDLSAQNPKGWIVDLRGNTGGNMWPMFTGIGPILGEGNVGSFVAADGNDQLVLPGWQDRNPQSRRSRDGFAHPG